MTMDRVACHFEGEDLADDVRSPRAGGITEDRVTLMIERAVDDALKAHEAKMIAHMDSKFGELDKTFRSAFPGGDPHGHRIAHEGQIKQAQGWEKLKADLVSKFLTGGLWVAGAWLLSVVWQQVVSQVARH